MGEALNQQDICSHLRPGRWPLEVRLVLDEHLGFTEALVRCRDCGRSYLLELLDWLGPARALRVAMPDSAEADGLVHDLSRGSCDVDRAGAEVQHLRSRAPFSRWLLLIDTGEPVIESVLRVPQGVAIPAASWRTLPKDGQWVSYLRSNTEIVKG